MPDRRGVDVVTANRAADFRRAFDGAFAVAWDSTVEQLESLLAIRVADDAYALNLSELAGIFSDRRITGLPGSPPGQLGIAGFRGMLVPVYDLRHLLGYAGEGTPSWLVLAAADPPLALAFDRLEGHIRQPRSAFAPCTQAGNRPVHEVVRTSDGVLPVIHLPTLIDVITVRSGPGRSPARNLQP